VSAQRAIASISPGQLLSSAFLAPGLAENGTGAIGLQRLNKEELLLIQQH
jgi:hypothetical protein